MPFQPQDSTTHKDSFLSAIRGKSWSNTKHKKDIVEALDRSITEEVVTGSPDGRTIAQNGWMKGVLDIISKIVHHGDDDSLPPFEEYADPGVFYDNIVGECFTALNRNEAVILPWPLNIDILQHNAIVSKNIMSNSHGQQKTLS